MEKSRTCENLPFLLFTAMSSGHGDGGGRHPRHAGLTALLVILGFVTCLGAIPAGAQLQPGDLVVMDYSAGPALFRVDSQGNRTLMSDFDNAAQGPTGGNTGSAAVAVLNLNEVLALDAGAGVRGYLFKVNVQTGARTVMSDFDNLTQGPKGAFPIGVLVTPAGEILVVDRDAGGGGLGYLFNIDPPTGNRTKISDFGDGTKGFLSSNPVRLAISPAGKVYFSDTGTPTCTNGVVGQVDLPTGQRTKISDFCDVNQGFEVDNPVGIAVLSETTLLLVGSGPSPSSVSALWKIDTVTGFRTLLTDFVVPPPPSQPSGNGANEVVVTPGGDILVMTSEGGSAFNSGSILSINPQTGAGTLLRDFGDNNGVKIGNPFGLAVAPAAAGLDHFLCYKTKATKGSVCAADSPVNKGFTCEAEETCGGVTDVSDYCLPNKFARREGIRLVDSFEDRLFDVRKPVGLCTPADKNGEGTADADTHLEAYAIQWTKEKISFPSVAKKDITVQNQFHPSQGVLRVDTIGPDWLLVPTAKSLTGPVEPLDPVNIDHFKCYKVKVSKGQPKFEPILGVKVDDQFITDPGKFFDLKKPTRLCTPVEKTRLPGGTPEPIKNEAAHLMCYQAKPISERRDLLERKHTPVIGIHVNNQFGAEQLDTIKEEELCVPSTTDVH